MSTFPNQSEDCSRSRRTWRVGRELPDVVLLQHCLGLSAVDGVELVAGVLPRHDEDAVRAARVVLQEGGAVIYLQPTAGFRFRA